MEERTLKRIFDTLVRLEKRKLSRSVGVITDTSPLEVTIADVPHLGVSVLDSYTPALNDRVYITRSGSDLLIHGKIT